MAEGQVNTKIRKHFKITGNVLSLSSSDLRLQKRLAAQIQ